MVEVPATGNPGIVVENFFRKHIARHSPLEGYNLWSKTYQQEKNPIKQLSDEFVRKSIPNLLGKKFLDAGCGPGIFCKEAEEQGASEVVGIDISPEMIKIAQTNCEKANFQAVDLESANLEISNFDVVVCSLVLGHVEKFNLSLQKLVDALKAGGVLILTDFHPYQSCQKAKRTFKGEGNSTHEVIHFTHHLSEYFAFLKGRMVVQGFEEYFYNDQPVVFGLVATKL